MGVQRPGGCAVARLVTGSWYHARNAWILLRYGTLPH